MLQVPCALQYFTQIHHHSFQVDFNNWKHPCRVVSLWLLCYLSLSLPIKENLSVFLWRCVQTQRRRKWYHLKMGAMFWEFPFCPSECDFVLKWVINVHPLSGVRFCLRSCFNWCEPLTETYIVCCHGLPRNNNVMVCQWKSNINTGDDTYLVSWYLLKR